MAFKKETREQKILREEMAKPANKTCFDCGEKSVSYANCDVGTFVCTSCSGLLRKFSFNVKSVSMATFKPDWVDKIKSTGNEKARAYWLATWTSSDYPMPDPQDLSRVEQFMNIKYNEKRWVPKPAEQPKPAPPPVSQPVQYGNPPPRSTAPPPAAQQRHDYMPPAPRGAFYLDEAPEPEPIANILGSNVPPLTVHTASNTTAAKPKPPSSDPFEAIMSAAAPPPSHSEHKAPPAPKNDVVNMFSTLQVHSPPPSHQNAPSSNFANFAAFDSQPLAPVTAKPSAPTHQSSATSFQTNYAASSPASPPNSNSANFAAFGAPSSAATPNSAAFVANFSAQPASSPAAKPPPAAATPSHSSAPSSPFATFGNAASASSPSHSTATSNFAAFSSPNPVVAPPTDIFAAPPSANQSSSSYNPYAAAGVNPSAAANPYAVNAAPPQPVTAKPAAVDSSPFGDLDPLKGVKAQKQQQPTAAPAPSVAAAPVAAPAPAPKQTLGSLAQPSFFSNAPSQPVFTATPSPASASATTANPPASSSTNNSSFAAFGNNNNASLNNSSPATPGLFAQHSSSNANTSGNAFVAKPAAAPASAPLVPTVTANAPSAPYGAAAPTSASFAAFPPQTQHHQPSPSPYAQPPQYGFAANPYGQQQQIPAQPVQYHQQPAVYGGASASPYGVAPSPYAASPYGQQQPIYAQQPQYGVAPQLYGAPHPPAAGYPNSGFVANFGAPTGQPVAHTMNYASPSTVKTRDFSNASSLPADPFSM